MWFVCGRGLSCLCSVAENSDTESEDDDQSVATYHSECENIYEQIKHADRKQHEKAEKDVIPSFVRDFMHDSFER